MRAYLDRLGDRFNPVLVKEIRQAVNSRFVSTAMMLLLVVQLIVMIFQIENYSSTNRIDSFIGRELFLYLQGILVVLSLILIPVMSAGRLGAERSDVNVDLLFISSLSPRAIITGKFLAAIALAMLVFSACAPFMTFAYVLRGLDIQTILLVLAIDFMAVLYGTMAALLLAAIPAGRLLRVLLGLIGIGFLVLIAVLAIRQSTLLLEIGFFRFDLGSREAWLMFAALAAVVVGLIGLMFFWSIALLSPTTANRAMPVRLYTAGLWLAWAIVCGCISYANDTPLPAYVAGFVGFEFFAFQMIISICERDSLGPRVLRRIPRSPYLRIPAFLLYSGAAGGIVFSTIGMAVSIIWFGMWTEVRLGSSRLYSYGDMSEIIWGMSLIAGYTYCYCLTAVLVRRMLPKPAFQSYATWLLAVILVALGCIIPRGIFEVIYQKSISASYWHADFWIVMTNPFVVIDRLGHYSGQYSSTGEYAAIFLAFWGVVITLINAMWFFRQIVNFKPVIATLARSSKAKKRETAEVDSEV